MKSLTILKQGLKGRHTHLIGRDHHGGETNAHALEELEARLVEEERAAVGAVVALDIQTRGPGLGEEVAAVAQAAQHGQEGVVVVVHLLQAHHVRLVGEDLLQDQVLPLGPAQRLQGAADEAVRPLTQRWRRG